ncbi:MAG: Zn-dependent protease, partial [Rhizobiales bacterium 35-66-30]
FRALCGGVVLRVEDFPEDDVLEELEAESPFDLLGLFQGVGLAQAGAISETGRLPNMVFLYRRPILDYWSENEETLGEIIAHVLIHEIGHHFGLSDDDMERVESQVED